MYFGLCWVFVAALELSLLAESWGYSSLRCAGFSLVASLVAEHGLWGTRASVVMAPGL